MCSFECEDEGVYTDVNDRSPRHEERAQDAPNVSLQYCHKAVATPSSLQSEQKGCRLCSFKCEDEGVYTDVNDRSPRHEERAQDAPLSSVWCG